LKEEECGTRRRARPPLRLLRRHADTFPERHGPVVARHVSVDWRGGKATAEWSAESCELRDLFGDVRLFWCLFRRRRCSWLLLGLFLFLALSQPEPARPAWLPAPRGDCESRNCKADFAPNRGRPPVPLLSYLGFLFVPLGHGGIIQPACAALGGMFLARFGNAWYFAEREKAAPAIRRAGKGSFSTQLAGLVVVVIGFRLTQKG
jgi:hypothetical protein